MPLCSELRKIEFFYILNNESVV